MNCLSPDPSAADVRTQRVRSGVLTGVAVRATSLLSPLVIIPLALDSLGKETYGVWMTVTALTSMLLWADLGLGNGLLTKVSHAVAAGDYREARSCIATSYALLGGLAFASCGVLVATAGVFPWGSVFNTRSPRANEVAVVAICLFLLNVPLGQIQKIQYALQEVALSNVLMAVGPALSIAGVVACRWLDAGPVALIFTASVGPSLAFIAATVWTFRRHCLIRPQLSDMEWAAARSLVALGSVFMIVQVLSSVALNVDNFIVAHVAGAERVADYSIAARLFSIVGLLISMMNLPLWPANAEALAHGEEAWVRRTTTRMMYLCLACMTLAGGTVVLWGSRFIELWVGDSVHISTVMLSGFAVFWTIVAVTSPYLMVQNSQGLLGPQLVAWAVFFVVSVPLKLVAAEQSTDWLPWIAAAVYLLTLAPAAHRGYTISLRSASAKRGRK